MVGKVLEIDDWLNVDKQGYDIAHNYITWETMRQNRIAEWTEIQKYISAPDRDWETLC